MPRGIFDVQTSGNLKKSQYLQIFDVNVTALSRDRAIDRADWRAALSRDSAEA